MAAFIILFIIIALIIQQRSRAGDLSCLSASVSADTTVVEPGQEFVIKVELYNRAFRFLPYLKLRIYMPDGIEFPRLKKGTTARSSTGGFELILTTWMLPKQKLSMSIPAVINARGRYFANGMNISCGDFFGLNEMSTRYDSFTEVVCLPKETDGNRALKIAGGFPGDLSVNRFIFEDPVLTIGFRDYTGREPMKQISWKQSAKSGRLVVKEMDHTLESSVSVVLNIDTSCENREEAIEKAYSMARYVCRKLEESQLTYSFSSNSIALGNVKSWKYIAEGLGRTHFGYILEGLGRSNYNISQSFRNLLASAARRSSGSYGLVFITAGDESGQCLEAQRTASRAGLQLLCINAGGEI